MIKLKGTLTVEAEDIFEEGMEEFDDCWIRRKRTPLIFNGLNLENGNGLSGTLELIIKDRFPNLGIDNKLVPVKITIEPL